MAKSLDKTPMVGLRDQATATVAEIHQRITMTKWTGQGVIGSMMRENIIKDTEGIVTVAARAA